MKNLAPIPSPPLPYFEAIAIAKQSPRRQRLQALTPFVSGRYSQYATGTVALASIARRQLPAEAQSDLVHCYDVRTVALDRLKADIARHHALTCPAAASVCQYCGLTIGPDGFDHYLPKGTFPEFATLSINLIPCCGECNRRKDEHWLDDQGNREIVNFYYDTLPATRVLFADIVMTNNDPVPLANFTVSTRSADYDGLMAIVHNHYARLNLLRRYGLAATSEFEDIRVELGPIVRAGTPADAAQILVKRAVSLSASRSANYWKVALYHGMAANTTYLSSLAT